MHDRHYWLRLIRLFVVALVAAVLVLPIGFGVAMMWGLTQPGCARWPGPESFGLSGETVQIESDGYTLPGWFFPGTNGATVIVAPAYANDRNGDLPDAAILNRAGFNVLTFDARTCDGSPVHSLGYLEANDAVAAYHYLETRPDVDAGRVSIHGFSSAGSTSLFTAARLPQLRAVSAKGGYHNFADQLGLGRQDNALYVLIRLGAELGYRLSVGQDVRVLSPLASVPNISPRPILLIYGSREVSLPGAREMLAAANAAGGNAELWVVEGAGHGNYLAVAGAEYEQRLTEFHRAALLGG